MNKIKQLGFFFTSLAFFIVLSLFATKNASASNVGGFEMLTSGQLIGWAKIIDYKYTAIGQNNINGICTYFYDAGYQPATVSVYVNGTFAGTLTSSQAPPPASCITFNPIGGNGYNNDNYTISFNLSGDPSQNIAGNGAIAFQTSYINNASYFGSYLDGTKFYYNNNTGDETFRMLGFIKTTYDDGYIPPPPPPGDNVFFGNSKVCYIGEPCNITVAGSNILVNGWKSYLGVYPNCPPISNHPEYTLSTTTIANGYGNLLVPTSNTQNVINYKISSYSPNNSMAECSDVTVHWEEDSQTQELFYDTEKLHNLCGDVATSTGGILDDVRFALECAVRSSFYFLFSPSKSVTSKITDNFDNLKIRFPFSAYFQLTDTITDSFASSSIKQKGFSVPFIEKTATSTQFYMIEVMGSSSMEKAIGKDNADMFRNLFTIIIWSSVALIIYIKMRK